MQHNINNNTTEMISKAEMLSQETPNLVRRVHLLSHKVLCGLVFYPVVQRCRLLTIFSNYSIIPCPLAVLGMRKTGQLTGIVPCLGQRVIFAFLPFAIRSGAMKRNTCS